MFRVPFGILLLVLAAACATNPVTGRREFNLMSEAQEISLGQESDPQIKQEMGVYNDAALETYISGIGQRIAKISERPHLPWRFTVVDQPAVNAFAVPGGVHLLHARHPAFPRQRSRSGWRDRATKSAT